MPYKEPEYKDPKSINQPLFPDVGLQLHCPNCSHDIPSSDININRSIAKCASCDTVFSFEKELKSPMRKRPEIFMPEEIEMFSVANELGIWYKWRKVKSLSYFLVFFTIVWNIIVFPMALAAIASGEWIALLGMSIHLLVGAGLLFYTFLQLINSTYITVDEYELAIEHRPIHLPFYYKNQYVNVRDIDQLYTKKYTATKSKSGYKTHAYAVVVKLIGGKEIELLKEIKQKEKALFIEQEVELFLGIKDRHVDGETG